MYFSFFFVKDLKCIMNMDEDKKWTMLIKNVSNFESKFYLKVLQK